VHGQAWESTNAEAAGDRPLCRSDRIEVYMDEGEGVIRRRGEQMANGKYNERVSLMEQRRKWSKL
jgi:hypothetical protein